MNKSNYRKHKKRDKLLQELITRDGKSCCYCDKPLRIFEMTLEHIVPKSFGGGYKVSNLTIACRRCNIQRGNKEFFQYIKSFDLNFVKYNKYCLIISAPTNSE